MGYLAIPAATPRDGVHLVDEDDGPLLLACRSEQRPDPPGPDTDVLLHEVRAGSGEHRYSGLTRDGAGQQGLSRAWRPGQQSALGGGGAGASEAFRLLEEHDKLLQLGLGLVAAGDITAPGLRIGCRLDGRRLLLPETPCSRPAEGDGGAPARSLAVLVRVFLE